MIPGKADRQFFIPSLYDYPFNGSRQLTLKIAPGYVHTISDNRYPSTLTITKASSHPQQFLHALSPGQWLNAVSPNQYAQTTQISNFLNIKTLQV